MQLPLSISPAQLVKELERQAVAAEAVKKLEAYWYGGQAINSKDVLAGLKKILGQIKKSPAV
jgi:hypothetical protein